MPFLRAEWRDILMLNWQVPPERLAPFVPRGTRLDTWNGRVYLSLVAFRFLNTRVLRLRVPFHSHFEELNLRFYVKRQLPGETRRGVVFIKELAPRACVVQVARRLYNENYVTAKMSHMISIDDGRLHVRYDWEFAGRENSLTAHCDGSFHEMAPDSHEEFIAEHYWGYTRQRDGGTVEYHVRHPRWQIATVQHHALVCDAVSLYGQALGECLSAPPESAFLANGSPIEVAFGSRLPTIA